MRYVAYDPSVTVKIMIMAQGSHCNKASVTSAIKIRFDSFYPIAYGGLFGPHHQIISWYSKSKIPYARTLELCDFLFLLVAHIMAEFKQNWSTRGCSNHFSNKKSRNLET